MTPWPGSLDTVSPSADTVPVPSISSLPVVWLKLTRYVFSPAASPNTLGNVRLAGVVSTEPPGVWIVMSNVCCSRPGGSSSLISALGTGLMPTTAFATGLPLASSNELGATVIDNCPICLAVRFSPLDPALSIGA